MRLAILGCGNIAKFHITAMRKAGFKIVSAASRKDSTSIREFVTTFGISEAFRDPQDLLASHRWDALLVAIPTEEMANYLPHLAREKRPILIEKPGSHDYRDLLDISNHKNIFFAYNRRHYFSVQYAREFINSTGDPVLIKLCIPEKVRDDGREFRGVPYYLLENSVHIFDAARFLVGDFKWDFVNRIRSGAHRYDFLIASGSSSSRVAITLDMPMGHPENFSIDIYSRGERVCLKPIESLHHYKGMSVIDPGEGNAVRSYHPKEIFSASEVSAGDQKPGFMKQAEAFYAYSKCGNAGVLATPADSIAALKLAEGLST